MAQCHVSHILLVKASHKASLDWTGGETDPASRWEEWSVHTGMGEIVGGHICRPFTVAPRVSFWLSLYTILNSCMSHPALPNLTFPTRL